MLIRRKSTVYILMILAVTVLYTLTRIPRFPALLLTLHISLITVLHPPSHTMETVEK